MYLIMSHPSRRLLKLLSLPSKDPTSSLKVFFSNVTEKQFGIFSFFRNFYSVVAVVFLISPFYMLISKLIYINIEVVGRLR